MNELQELYQQLILDHNANPRHYGRLAECTHSAEGHNPLCGDQIFLELKIEDSCVSQVAFSGEGCAICKASSSLMTERLAGKSVSECKELFTLFHALATGEEDAAQDSAALGKLVVFSGVREFPMRVKCATLCWHTLMAAFENKNEVAVTE
ncbi:MAG: SUF system NifU family Fe-S cluster assembly protein [Myxococcota bacterium]|jgi:nitrogen fixation NifU-like protein|nr:SUF system NifU family Fe-S cluster assembly protein [Myxococcota bacterium]